MATSSFKRKSSWSSSKEVSPSVERSVEAIFLTDYKDKSSSLTEPSETSSVFRQVFVLIYSVILLLKLSIT